MARNTHQKENVLQVLRSMRGVHPTAEMVYQEVCKVIPSISKATVYRILSQSAQGERIAQLHVPDSPDRYDDLMTPHYHLLCTSCKRVVDLATPQIQQIPLPQEDASGCKITGVELTFLGVCSHCASSQ